MYTHEKPEPGRDENFNDPVSAMTGLAFGVIAVMFLSYSMGTYGLISALSSVVTVFTGIVALFWFRKIDRII